MRNILPLSSGQSLIRARKIYLDIYIGKPRLWANQQENCCFVSVDSRAKTFLSRKRNKHG
jgi:hypothetical protein